MSKPSLLKTIRTFQADKIPTPRDCKRPHPWPTDVAIEIGAGAGLHAVRFGKEHPKTTLFAIEHTHERYSKLEGRIRQNQVQMNVIPIHANAIGWITHFVPHQSTQQIFLLYPNPYPKKKHLNRRWYADPFFTRIVESLKPGGQFILATNLPDYAQGAREWIQEVWKLRLTSEQAISQITHPDHVPWTHFEKKYLMRGETVFHLIFHKV